MNGQRRASVGAGAAVTAAEFAYLAWRSRMLRWGATEEEAAGGLPGDERKPHPRVQSTRAITIDAPPETVCPWIVQMGMGRAGFYTHEWVERPLGATTPRAIRRPGSAPSSRTSKSATSSTFQVNEWMLWVHRPPARANPRPRLRPSPPLTLAPRPDWHCLESAEAGPNLAARSLFGPRVRRRARGPCAS